MSEYPTARCQHVLGITSSHQCDNCGDPIDIVYRDLIALAKEKVNKMVDERSRRRVAEARVRELEEENADLKERMVQVTQWEAPKYREETILDRVHDKMRDGKPITMKEASDE